MRKAPSHLYVCLFAWSVPRNVAFSQHLQSYSPTKSSPTVFKFRESAPFFSLISESEGRANCAWYVRGRGDWINNRGPLVSN